MRIYEIEKISSEKINVDDVMDYPRWQYRNSTQFKKFSNSDFYYLNDIGKGIIIIAVINTDTKNPTPNGLLIVGVLHLYPRKINNIYNKPIVGVSSIAVDKRYHGQGIAGKLYNIVLKSGYILFAGDSQTPSGRAMWVNLNKRSDVEVTGWVKFYVEDSSQSSYSDDSQSSYSDDSQSSYSDDDFIEFIEQQGGAYFGERITTDSGKVMFFEFEVEQLPTKAELEIRGKKSPIKVYYTEGADTGLMARYIG